jgi:hypothetical protein
MRLKLVIAGLFCSTLLSATNYGLIVGCCGEYKDTALNGLKGIGHDVRVMETILLERECSRKNLITLKNKTATKRNIKENLSKLEDKLQSGDKLYFYFSGHGARATDRKEVFLSEIKGDSDINKRLNRTALITYDYNDNRRYDSSLISYDDLRPLFERLDKRGVQVVMFADACFAGKSYKRGNQELDDEEKLLDIAISMKFKKPKGSEPYNSLIFFGASLNSLQARQTPNGGIFTNSLEYCFNKADTDKNGDGGIGKDELQRCMINSYSNYAKNASIYPVNRLGYKSIIRASKSSTFDNANLIKIKYSGKENLLGIAKRVQKGYDLELVQNGNDIDIYHIGRLYSSINSQYLAEYLKAYRLFALKSNNLNVKIDYFSEQTRKIEDTFCANEIIRIRDKNLGSKQMSVLTLDRNGKVIILKSEKDYSVRTEVFEPYGIDRVKVFTYSNPKIFKQTLAYQKRNNGILTPLEVNHLYDLLSQEKSLQVQGFEIRTTKTNIKECLKGDR